WSRGPERLRSRCRVFVRDRCSRWRAGRAADRLATCVVRAVPGASSVGPHTLEDQQLAGLLMWVPGGVAFAAGALFLFAGWLRQSDRMSRFKSTPTLRPGSLRS